jgi:DNA (cytosine-5)-methyltransferase 1
VIEPEIIQIPRGNNNGGNHKVCPTITSHSFQDNNFCNTGYRIRKLTPLECFRLMGFTDEEFYKAQAVNSNSQLYKQAGNSIVVDVLYHLFKNLFVNQEESTMQLSLF